MRLMLSSTLAAAMLIISTTLAAAAAQTPAQNSGTAGIAPAPGSSSTTGIGAGPGTTSNPTMTPGNTNRPGVPGTSARGTGASPSGLPDDNPMYPGYPTGIGR